VKITGLGLPSEMAEYITNGSCPYMFLWNPIDLGYLASYAAVALSSGKITGKVGDQFGGGKLGQYKVISSSDGGTEVILGPPFKFEPSNINEWKSVD
jgi:rhamnose transport system substrate-binding protein